MIHESLAADFFILYSAKACVCGTLSDGYVPDMAAIPPDRTIILPDKITIPLNGARGQSQH